MIAPCLADPAHNSLVFFRVQAVATFIFLLGRWVVCVLISAGSPSFVAGIDFNEQTFARVFVPKKSCSIQHHCFDAVERDVVVRSFQPGLGERLLIACEPVQRSSNYAVMLAVLTHLLRASEEGFELRDARWN